MAKPFSLRQPATKSSAALDAEINDMWTCQGCASTKWEIWCWNCDIHWSGKTVVEMREEKAVRNLDMALSAMRDPEKVVTS